MWKAKLTTKVNGPIDKIWEVLVTPSLWTKVDPKHYKEVVYEGSQLKPHTKGKMKTEDSPMVFSFKVVDMDSSHFELATQSSIPFGKLIIVKTLGQNKNNTEFSEDVIATGPFAKLFAKLFFQKQIADTLPAQHQAIKAFVENKIG